MVIKKSTVWAARCAFWSLVLVSPIWAQGEAKGDTKDGTKPGEKAATPASKLEIVNVGELRIDGKITAILGAGVWQVEAVSWTSPRGVTTDFEEVKSKAVKVGAQSVLHPRGEDQTVPLGEVKLGSRVGIIGRNSTDGSLIAREVVLLEGYGSRKTIGQLQTNPLTLRLVSKSRAARDAGQIARAIEFIDQAIVMAKGMNDLSGEGLATQDQAMLFIDQEKFDEAMESFKRVETVGKTLNNPLLMSMGMGGQGGLLRRSQQFDESIEVLKRADPISARSEAQIHLSILGSLMASYLESGNREGAVEVLSRIFPLEEASGKEADATETHLTIALLQVDEKPEEVRQILDAMAPRIERARDEKIKSRLIGTSAAIRWRLGDTDEARVNFEQAAQIAQAAGGQAQAKRWRELPARLEGAGPKWESFWAIIQGINTVEAPKAEAPKKEPTEAAPEGAVTPTDAITPETAPPA